MQALENAVLGRLARRAHALDPIADFDARCVTIGARVRVILPDRAYTGVAEGITANGALLVRDDMDNVNLVMAGDVSVRGIMGYV